MTTDQLTTTIGWDGGCVTLDLEIGDRVLTNVGYTPTVARAIAADFLRAADMADLWDQPEGAIGALEETKKRRETVPAPTLEATEPDADQGADLEGWSDSGRGGYWSNKYGADVWQVYQPTAEAKTVKRWRCSPWSGGEEMIRDFDELSDATEYARLIHNSSPKDVPPGHRR